MDHIPKPDRPRSPEIRIRCYGNSFESSDEIDMEQLLISAKMNLLPHHIPPADWHQRDAWLGDKFHEFLSLVNQMASRPQGGDAEYQQALQSLILHLEKYQKELAESSSICDALQAVDAAMQLQIKNGNWRQAVLTGSLYRTIVRGARVAKGAPGIPGDPEALPDIIRMYPKGQLLDCDDNIMCTLQNQFFFGTLRAVFCTVSIEVDSSDFIEKDAEGSWLTTKHLMRYIDEWKKTRSNLNEQDAGRVAKVITSKLQYPIYAAVFLEAAIPESYLGGTKLTLGILILTSTLQYWTNKIYAGQSRAITTCASSSLRSMLITSEWCPNVVDNIQASMPLPWQYYIYLMGPNPSIGNLPQRHLNCTASYCPVNQIGPDYKPKHRPEITGGGNVTSANCKICLTASNAKSPDQSFESDLGSLQKIVDRGGIPLISISRSTTESNRFLFHPEVVQYESDVAMEYIAISHVRTDGLGNRDKNEVYPCQLSLIHKYLEQASSETTHDQLYFWLDTLCVPLKPPETLAKAIKSIPEVFREAKTTLVLSNEFQSLQKPRTMVEAITRVAVSNWNQRLWGYTEAMLSSSVRVEFADGAVDLHNYFDGFEAEETRNPALSNLSGVSDAKTSIEFAWASDAAKNMKKLLTAIPNLNAPIQRNVEDCFKMVSEIAKNGREGKSRELTRSVIFRVALSGFASRSTTHPSDEILCLCELLGVDLKALLNLLDPGEKDLKPLDELKGDKKDRALKILLQFQHSFHRDLLFIDARRFGDTKFRWSPKSFMSPGGLQGFNSMGVDPTALALLSNEGLVLQLPGILFTKYGPLITDSKVSFMLDVPSNIKSWDQDRQLEETGKDRTLVVHGPSIGNDIAANGEPNSNEMAILFNPQWPFPFKENGISQGVLVSIQKQITGISFTCFVCLVTLGVLDFGELVVPDPKDMLQPDPKAIVVPNPKDVVATDPKDMVDAESEAPIDPPGLKGYNVYKLEKILTPDQGWCIS